MLLSYVERMNLQNLKDRFSKTILCLIIICSLSLPLLQSKRQVYWLSKFLHLTCSGDIDTTWLKNLRPGNEAHYQIKRQLLIKLVSKHTSFLNLVRSSKNIVGFTSWYGLLFVFLETIIFHNIHSIYTLRYLCVSCLDDVNANYSFLFSHSICGGICTSICLWFATPSFFHFHTH